MSDISFSDDDEEIISFLGSDFSNRTVLERSDNYATMRERDFHRRFRLKKISADFLLQKIKNKLAYNSDRNCPVSPMNQLLCTLRFYATGSQLITAGDVIGIHESTACRIVHKVTDAIACLYPDFIKMPRTGAEQNSECVKFYNIARFPRCIGAIDCTHIKINSPGGEFSELYRNRKGIFSLNVQAICNADMLFTDVVSRWHGSAHDSNIWDNCNQHRYFLQGLYGDKLLVGDAGYAQQPYMMVPLANVACRADSLYNESQIRTRNLIERCFGIWKRRFPVLSRGIQVKLSKIPGIIIATAVLHNICTLQNDPEPPAEVEYPPNFNIDNEPHNYSSPATTAGQRARAEIIAQMFSRLP